MRQSGPGGKRRRAGFYSAIRREVPIRIFSIALKQFGLLPPAETTWQRPHWLADDTVLIGPVSHFKFPASRDGVHPCCENTKIRDRLRWDSPGSAARQARARLLVWLAVVMAPPCECRLASNSAGD